MWLFMVDVQTTTSLVFILPYNIPMSRRFSLQSSADGVEGSCLANTAIMHTSYKPFGSRTVEQRASVKFRRMDTYQVPDTGLASDDHHRT